MDLNKIESGIKDALRQVRELERKNKEDLRVSEARRRQFLEMQKNIEHAMANPVGATAGGSLFILLEILAETEHDRELIKIRGKEYHLREIGTLAQIGGERLELIQQAKRNGIELSDEAQKMLKDDRFGLLLDEKKLTEHFAPAGKEGEQIIDRIEEKDQDIRSRLEKIEEKHERAEEEMI